MKNYFVYNNKKMRKDEINLKYGVDSLKIGKNEYCIKVCYFHPKVYFYYSNTKEQNKEYFSKNRYCREGLCCVAYNKKNSWVSPMIIIRLYQNSSNTSTIIKTRLKKVFKKWFKVNSKKMFTDTGDFKTRILR